VLEAAVGNRSLALSVTFEVADAGVAGRPDPNEARAVVARLAEAGRSIAGAPLAQRQVWEALRYLRRVLRAAAGGLAVGADLLSPEVTGLTKGASIGGGLATIAGALPVEKDLILPPAYRETHSTSRRLAGLAPRINFVCSAAYSAVKQTKMRRSSRLYGGRSLQFARSTERICSHQATSSE
jgi:hypothetical protein